MFLLITRPTQTYALAGGLSACCATACSALAVAITSGTGGLGIRAEAADTGMCIAECISTGGIVQVVVVPGAGDEALSAGGDISHFGR